MATLATTQLPPRFISKETEAVRYETYCYPPGSETWSLGTPNGRAQIAKKCAELGVTDVFATRTNLPSALIACEADFDRIVEIGHGVRLHLVSDPDLAFEGTSLQPRQAFWYLTGGCPIIVGTGGDMLVPVHAGRDSFLDRPYILTGVPGRTHFSVIDALAHRFLSEGVPLGKVELRAHFWFRPELFIHRGDGLHGLSNRMMFEFIKDTYPNHHIADGTKHQFTLDLIQLFYAQAQKAGFARAGCGKPLNETVGNVHTRLVDTKKRSQRNGVPVIRIA